VDRALQERHVARLGKKALHQIRKRAALPRDKDERQVRPGRLRPQRRVECVDFGLGQRLLDEHDASRIASEQRRQIGKRLAPVRVDAVLPQKPRGERPVGRIGRDDGDVHGIPGSSLEAFPACAPRNCGTPVITPWKLKSGSPTTRPFLAMRNSRMVSSW